MKNRATSPTPIRPVDITGGERRLGARLATMQKVVEHFARGARRSLPFLARRRARLVPGELGGALTMDPPSPGPLCRILLEAPGRSGWAALRLDPGSIQLVVDGSLGGAPPEEGAQEAVAPPVQLSLAQRALVTRVARALGADFVEALREGTGAELSVVSAECVRGEDLPALPKDAVVAECLFDGVSGKAVIWLVAGGDLVEAQSKGRASGADARVDPRLAEALRGVPLEVVAELGRVKLGLRRVLALRPGEVLRLPAATDDPVQVRIAGITKLFGVPVISRGQLSIQITGRHAG